MKQLHFNIIFFVVGGKSPSNYFALQISHLIIITASEKEPITCGQLKTRARFEPAISISLS